MYPLKFLQRVIFLQIRKREIAHNRLILKNFFTSESARYYCWKNWHKAERRQWSLRPKDKQELVTAENGSLEEGIKGEWQDLASLTVHDRALEIGRVILTTARPMVNESV